MSAKGKEKFGGYKYEKCRDDRENRADREKKNPETKPAETATELKLEGMSETAGQPAASDEQNEAETSAVAPASVEEIVTLAKTLGLSPEAVTELYSIFKAHRTQQLRDAGRAEFQKVVSHFLTVMIEKEAITVEQPDIVFDAIANLV